MTQHELDPSAGSTLELCNKAFILGQDDPSRFTIDSYHTPVGEVWETCDYMTEPGNKIRIERPSQDTREIMELSTGPGSVHTEAIVSINAAHKFMVDLTGGDKFHAFNKFVGLVILPEGVFVDFRPVGTWTYETDEGDKREELVAVGSLLRPIAVSGDGVVQQFIDPSRVISRASA